MTSLSKILRQTQLYRSLLVRYVRYGNVRELVSSRFPFVRTEPPAPRVVAIEFTNACDLKCVYCDAQHPAQMRRRGFMTERTLRNALSQVSELGVQKLRIIGAGEATIHPRFSQLIRCVAGAAPVVSLTTNGQSLDQNKALALADSVDVVEFSVDSDCALTYERLRVGGRFSRLLGNLDLVRAVANQQKSRLVIHVRLMLRPSDYPHRARLVRFWRQHGDLVSTDLVKDYHGCVGDAFPVFDDSGSFRRCSSPFKHAGIHWNGDVPLCDASALRLGDPTGLVLGNIDAQPLAAIWGCQILRQYRTGHRRRDYGLATLCRGCGCIWK